MKVDINELFGIISIQFDGINTYINRKTGEFISVLSRAEYNAKIMDSEEIEELLSWEQTEVKLALAIIENPMDYERIPDSFEIDEYWMMEQFCDSVEDKYDKEALLKVIKHSGSSRRFDDKVHQLGLTYDWLDFQDECYEQFVIDFCEARGLEYE